MRGGIILPAALFGCVAWGCTNGHTPAPYPPAYDWGSRDSGTGEGGVSEDGGQPDGGSGDAGSRDGGRADGGRADGGASDAGGDGGGPGEKEIVTRAHDCGIISAGHESVPAAYLPYDTCYYDCLVSRSCADLRDLICGSSTALKDTCNAQCQFACADGSHVPGWVQCDGSSDCPDASDEQDCGPYEFRCNDGHSIPLSERCDGWSDCAGEEDEEGCPGFRCANGHLIPWLWWCDEYYQCSDYSDEGVGAGCATLLCP